MAKLCDPTAAVRQPGRLLELALGGPQTLRPRLTTGLPLSQRTRMRLQAHHTPPSGRVYHSNGLSLRLLRRCLQVANFGESPECELRLNGILRRSLPEKRLPGIYIVPWATAIVPAVYTRAVGGGRVHQTARKGGEDAKVRDNASGLTAATEPSDLLLARSVGGGSGARSARSTQGSSCCRCSRRWRELRPSAHRHPTRNRHYLPQRPGARVFRRDDGHRDGDLPPQRWWRWR